MIDNSRLVIDQAAFLAAYLRGRRRGTKRVAYQPRKLSWFTVQDALKRLTSLLGSMPDWTSLERFLPNIPGGRPDDPLERRAALSSTLIAGLELARGGQLRLRQGRVRPDPGGPRRRDNGGRDMTHAAPDEPPNEAAATPSSSMPDGSGMPVEGARVEATPAESSSGGDALVGGTDAGGIPSFREPDEAALRLAEASIFASATPMTARALSQIHVTGTLSATTKLFRDRPPAQS